MSMISTLTSNEKIFCILQELNLKKMFLFLQLQATGECIVCTVRITSPEVPPIAVRYRCHVTSILLCYWRKFW